jgi:F-type H+-transporting ATPase subunit epsilon
MNIEIITPEKTVFKGEASLIQLPGVDGLFEILNFHAPMISVLGKGKIKLKNHQNEFQFFDINGGTIEVKNNHVIVLAE